MAEARELDFHIYNSMTKQKEKFNPMVPGKVSMYVCGVTSYDFSHIGHARAYVSFDILFRYLKHIGYEVKYVRNFTDVDDKIIKRANELDEDPLSLSGRFCEEFLIDMADLQCLPPTEQPRVSDHMDQIRDMIAKIISNDCAYVVDGNVFFSVDSFPTYGRLSGRKLEDNRHGERISIDSRKRNPADFALWKAAKPGEISWDSPWGPGRPGWHIECSAMSSTYLTEIFDIHGGGMDLIFPHHENEIAQSCAACPNSNISYWMHNGFVTANDEKISKSVGNVCTIREVTKLYHPLALRHFLMGTHYRSPVNYSIGQIETSTDAIYYIYQTLAACESAISQSQELTETSGKKYCVTADARNCITSLRSHMEEKLADDLNTPSILNAALQEALKFLEKILSMLKKNLQKTQKLSNIESLIELEKEVKVVLNVLGLLSSSTYTEVLKQLKEKALKRAELSKEELSQRIEERAVLRKGKKFEEGGLIRKALTYKGISPMDVTIGCPYVPAEQDQANASDGQLPVTLRSKGGRIWPVNDYHGYGHGGPERFNRDGVEEEDERRRAYNHHHGRENREIEGAGVGGVAPVNSDDEETLILGQRIEYFNYKEMVVYYGPNSQFSAIAYHMYGDGNKQAEVRRELYKQLNQKRGWYEEMVKEDYDSFVDKLIHSNIWGDYITLQAAADFYKRFIIVIHSRPTPSGNQAFTEGMTLEFIPNKDDSTDRPVIALSTLDGLYYGVLQKLEWKSHASRIIRKYG